MLIFLILPLILGKPIKGVFNDWPNRGLGLVLLSHFPKECMGGPIVGRVLVTDVSPELQWEHHCRPRNKLLPLPVTLVTPFNLSRSPYAK